MPDTTPKFPNATVTLVGQDGNAFAIIGRVQRALRSAGATREEVAQFAEEATAGDYDNLLQTAMRWAVVE